MRYSKASFVVRAFSSPWYQMTPGLKIFLWDGSWRCNIRSERVRSRWEPVLCFLLFFFVHEVGQFLFVEDSA